MNLPFVIEKDPTTGTYILRFDASLYMQSNCLRYVKHRLFHGLSSERKDFKMEYGTAFHKALAKHYSGGSTQDVVTAAVNHYALVDVPDGDFRNSAHLVNCLLQYIEFHRGKDLLQPIKVADEWLLEIPFALCLYKTNRVEVLLSGTMDMIANYLGQRVVTDHKTTSLTQVDNYLNSYSMSPQLMTYVYAYKRKFPDQGISALINGIFLNKTNKNTFKRSDVISFSDTTLKKYENHLLRTVAEIVKDFESFLDGNTEAFPCNFTCCEKKFGSCEYLPICLQDNEGDAESIATQQFSQRTYNPLLFQV